ncbi:Serine/threonine/tyrosine-interacting protein [Drechslerella dactyloides]|uniref:Serine/threonine/tyrosine-interacting protein n=1 Tax=Drechslerella dactyloides TaxID=74499 RepID=A0AAD6IRE1_DREDA|nr:Serine/threonine/tyrosine-interacting protein [Drechslerella dactyloides]
MQIEATPKRNLSPNPGVTPLSTSPAHHPTFPWSNGIPSPPRILVPPPTLINDPVNRSKVGVRQFSPYASHSGSISASLSGSQLLANSGILPASVQDWRYESRREAQQILPHLYLGPLAAAKDLNFLRRENITLLIAVRYHVTAQGGLLNAYKEIAKDPELSSKIRFECVDVSGNPELIASFPVASRVIDDHLYRFAPPNFTRRRSDGLPQHPPSPGKTLVYCESGNERSAAVCAAYIMQHIDCTAVQAIQVIQGRRFCVCFDDAMKYLLTGYEPIWMARRDVERQMAAEKAPPQTITQLSLLDNGNSIAAPLKKTKRGIEEAYEDEDIADNDISNDYDVARFEKREGIAPFSDSQTSELSAMSVDDLMDD